MKKEKLGFFKKLYLVITDFRTYPFLVKYEKFINSILYLLTLTLIITLIYSINMMVKFNEAFNSVITNYNQAVPEFELRDGSLTVYNKYSEKVNNESYIVINTDYTYDEYTKTDEYGSLVIYENLALINKDRIVIETSNMFLGIPFEQLNFEINKVGFYNELVTQYENLSYLPYLIAMYISIFIGYFIAIFLKVIFLACLISVICFFTGIRLSFKNYIKIAIYAYTLPLIIELLATCLGVGTENYTYYTTLLLTYIYIVYAVRAVKLDVFIMMFSKKDNLKHTPKEFEDELKKYNEIANKENKNQVVNEEKKEDKDNK